MKYIMVIMSMSLFLISKAYSHEMTPTYLKLDQSLAENIYETSVDIFNRRKDVEYYEVSIYDKDWNRVPFASIERVFRVKYLNRKHVAIYLRKKDSVNALYVCTTSKLLKGGGTTDVSSRICSKIKE